MSESKFGDGKGEKLENAIDSHCHLDFKQFNKDRETVIKRAQESGVSNMINSGVDYTSNQRSLDLARQYDFIYATLGFSPNILQGQRDADLMKIEEQIRENACRAIGIGEAGLDYYHCKDAPLREKQAQVFSRVIEIAKSTGLPLIIHSRDAEAQALEMVKSLDKVVFHCFSGALNTMKEAVDRGFYISLATNVCISARHQILAKNVPLDFLLVETDSPFLSPRRGRNEPAFVRDSISLIARLKNTKPDEIAKITAANTKRIYSIH